MSNIEQYKTLSNSPSEDPPVQSELFPNEAHYLDILDRGYNAPTDKGYKAKTKRKKKEYVEKKREPILSVKIPKKLWVEDDTPTCLKGYVGGICENGHHFAKAMLCGREYCYACGEKNSWIHQKRYRAWLPYVNSMKSQGQYVVTIPFEHRDYFREKGHLNEFRRYVRRLMKRSGYVRGLCRWHWCGEDGKTWHPHLNLLFPAGYIAPEKLEELRGLIAARLSEMVKTPVNTVVAHYSYTTNRTKMRHRLRYVTRATWHVYDPYINDTVKGYTNNIKWGKWKHVRVDPVAEEDKMCCPLDGTRIKWRGHISDFTSPEDYQYLGKGLYIWKFKEPDT